MDLVLSASSIGVYDDCHYQWYLRYVEQHDGDQSVAAAIGQSVHKAVEEHFRAVMRGEPLKREVVVDRFNLEYVLNTSAIADPELPIDKAMIWGRRSLISYLEDVAPTIDPVLVEYGELLVVNGIHVSGYLDVAGRDGIIHDTKILKSKLRDVSRYLRAAIFYALLYRDKMGERERDTQIDVIVRLKRDRPYHVPYRYDGPISDRDISIFAQTLDRVADGIARGDFRPTGIAEDICRFCPVATVCEYNLALEEARA